MSLSSNTGHSVTDPNLSIGHLNARGLTLGRNNAAWKRQSSSRPADPDRPFRLARVGPGWLIGSIEAATNREEHRHAGVYLAVTDCRLHFLPYRVVRWMEEENPQLSMNLYKLMSLLATKRQEATIRQLDQFVTIMNAPTPRLRGGKRELAKLQNL